MSCRSSQRALQHLAVVVASNRHIPGALQAVLLVFPKACSLLRQGRHSIGMHTYELSGPAEVRLPGLLHNSGSLRVPLATGLFSDIWRQGGGDRVHCWITPVCFCAGLGRTDITWVGQTSATSVALHLFFSGRVSLNLEFLNSARLASGEPQGASPLSPPPQCLVSKIRMLIWG